MKLWAYVRKTAKALAAGVVGGATFLLGVWSEQASFTEAFTTMTGIQWLGLVLAILGAWGITHQTRNQG